MAWGQDVKKFHTRILSHILPFMKERNKKVETDRQGERERERERERENGITFPFKKIKYENRY